ncbi:hypothetical protein D3C72_765810 [compost metagenome]
MRRFVRHTIGRQFDELRMGAVGKKAQLTTSAPDFLTDQSLRAFDNDTGKIPTGNPWQRGVGETTQDVFHIAGIQPGSLDLHQHFVSAGYRGRHLDVTQGRQIAGFIELQCFHGDIHRRKRGNSGQPTRYQLPAHRPQLLTGQHAE